eukprot:5882681-Pleurochrysis_carterae.AAC.1
MHAHANARAHTRRRTHALTRRRTHALTHTHAHTRSLQLRHRIASHRIASRSAQHAGYALMRLNFTRTLRLRTRTRAHKPPNVVPVVP